ncbi:sensor histidine kinase [Segetibacter aerophilus]|uniref:Signal transduction histidine kinase internal region domain-containing protein n=1 Tax=Segetibacter aerophilus TaxID=670293 RepID=A0A512BGY7_9BACT|nr:histidine kinase [Segetibacter aerophilus]GEO11077.1 hypothetical protein SAE01_35730 [Segetibacter aerophilus]
MRELFKKPTTFTRIEFWAITTIFAFVIFFFVRDVFEWDDRQFADAPYRVFFEQVKMPFDFYGNYFLPQLIRHVGLYIALVALNFIIIPSLLKKEFVVRNIVLFVLVFIALTIMFAVTATHLREYLYASGKRDQIDQRLFLDAVGDAFTIISMLLIYTATKYAAIRLLAKAETVEAKYRFLRKEAIVAAMIWAVVLIMFRFGRAEIDIIIGWAIVIPSAIALYLFSFYRLIPRSMAGNKGKFFSYVLRSAFILFIAFFVVYLAFALPSGADDTGLGYAAFNTFFQLFVTVPVTWAAYKRHLKGNEEINVLQKELKRSSASVDFLRSQINPHFLFNALNTLYGTAIQENADRTSEGIQKLGDMMRFMLQENMQDKISLAREIDYLNNYISLQRLRTDANPIVQIQTEIQDRENLFQIAPMLLIPFVENAFKHGISFREQSHIKVTLEIKANTLYFDVHNSKHAARDNDPEKDKSGIGLENVKQRLKLFYPNNHELIIRETSKDFFVHLTIELAKSS